MDKIHNISTQLYQKKKDENTPSINDYSQFKTQDSDIMELKSCVTQVSILPENLYDKKRKANLIIDE